MRKYLILTNDLRMFIFKKKKDMLSFKWGIIMAQKFNCSYTNQMGVEGTLALLERGDLLPFKKVNVFTDTALAKLGQEFKRNYGHTAKDLQNY